MTAEKRRRHFRGPTTIFVTTTTSKKPEHKFVFHFSSHFSFSLSPSFDNLFTNAYVQWKWNRERKRKRDSADVHSAPAEKLLKLRQRLLSSVDVCSSHLFPLTPSSSSFTGRESAATTTTQQRRILWKAKVKYSRRSLQQRIGGGGNCNRDRTRTSWLCIPGKCVWNLKTKSRQECAGVCVCAVAKKCEFISAKHKKMSAVTVISTHSSFSKTKQ